MVDRFSTNLIFKALADETRRSFLTQLTEKPLIVTEFKTPHPMSLAAISKHLKALEQAQLITRTKHGREYRFTLNPNAIDATTGWLTTLAANWKANTPPSPMARIELYRTD